MDLSKNKTGTLTEAHHAKMKTDEKSRDDFKRATLEEFKKQLTDEDEAIIAIVGEDPQGEGCGFSRCFDFGSLSRSVNVFLV